MEYRSRDSLYAWVMSLRVALELYRQGLPMKPKMADTPGWHRRTYHVDRLHNEMLGGEPDDCTCDSSPSSLVVFAGVFPSLQGC